MNRVKQITITHIPEISAIYFALLQCGYDYYAIERSQGHIECIRNFIGFGIMMFFAAVLCLPVIFPTVSEIKSCGIGWMIFRRQLPGFFPVLPFPDIWNGKRMDNRAECSA